MKNLKGRFVLFLILELFWILWNNSWDLKTWLYGLVIVIPVVLLFSGGTYIFKGVKLSPQSVLYSIYYVGVFIAELAKSNVDVIFRVLNPKLPVRPGIVRVQTRLKSPAGKADPGQLHNTDSGYICGGYERKSNLCALD